MEWKVTAKDSASQRTPAGNAIVFFDQVHAECELGRYIIGGEAFVNDKNEKLSEPVFGLIGINNTLIFIGKTLEETKKFAEDDYNEKVNKVLEARKNAEH